jgi:hypothetical protein
MKHAYQPHVWPATWFWDKNPYVVGGNIPRVRDRVTKENYDFGQLIPDARDLSPRPYGPQHSHGPLRPNHLSGDPTLRYCDKLPCRELFGNDYPEQAVQLNATTCLCPCRTCVNNYDLALSVDSVGALNDLQKS